MRDYQLEGLTWMYEDLFPQGMSGILADEMGLGTSAITSSHLCVC